MNILKDRLFHVFIYGLIWGGLLYVAFITAVPNIINSPVTADSPTSTIQAILYTEVVQYNLAFLSISLVVIVLIGGIFYLFNLRPLQEGIKKQEDLLGTERREFEELQIRIEADFLNVGVKLEQQFQNTKEEIERETKKLEEATHKKIDEGLQSLEEKFATSLSNADKKIAEIKSAAEDIEMDSVWYQQYIWKARGTTLNELSSLVEYLELCLKYNKKGTMELCLENIDKVFDRIGAKSGERIDRLNKRLMTSLSKIEGRDELKKSIISKVQTKSAI